jgi:O-succinylbenzoate synthase
MLHLIELAIPLRRPFVAASGVLHERRSLLVGVEGDGVTGWGEVAPYPGQGVASVDEIWGALSSGSADMTAAVPALANAIADRSARIGGTPLWRRLGGSGNPIRACLAVGATSSTLDEVEAAVQAGYRRVKLKIRPDHDVNVVREIRERFPALEVGVDANGSYRAGADAALVEIDELGVVYFEQPYPPDDLAAHRSLRRRVEAPVALDESIRSIDDAVAALSSEAADLLVVKPGRLGIAACCAIHDLAVDAGVRVKPSGLIETGIGRAFTLALASLPGSIFPDLAPANAFLQVDPIVPTAPLLGDAMLPPERPGIGCDPDSAAAAAFTIRSVSLPF